MKISVTVKPNSKKGNLIIKNPEAEDYIIYLREKPVDGKANEALINFISKHFKTPKTRIKILKGATSNHKLIEID
jgi:uncharacterized protein (TIGR00251 family)